MANILTLNNPTPATVPGDGWIVGYKILGSGGPYTVAGPFMSMPININTADPVGTLYEGYIVRDCGALESAQFFWQTPCNCTNAGPGYVEAPSGLECQLTDEVEPDITNSGYCLATSQNTAYTNYCSRIYTPSYVDADFAANFALYPPFGGGSNPAIYAQMNLEGYWCNAVSPDTTKGPLNREGVWIDSDCNGTKDPLGAGVQTTLSYTYNNPGPAKTIYVGVGADNQWQVVVNGTQVADSLTGGDYQFKIWHIIPINVVTGPNFINVIGTGDGSVNDAMGMVVYDNTDAEIAAATSDLDLNIPFASHTLRGTSFDVATCPSGYSLDTSGGAGNYTCTRTLYAACNQAP